MSTIQTPAFVNTYGPWSEVGQIARPVLGYGQMSSSASSTWPTANVAVYYPIHIPFTYTVARVFWVNGSAVASNMEFAIYNSSFSQVYTTGSVAQSGASVPQYVAGSVTLNPDQYYFALTCSGTTNTIWGANAISATQLRSMGVFQSSHAPGSLPATVTPAQNTKNVLPLMGVTRTSSGY